MTGTNPRTNPFDPYYRAINTIAPADKLRNLGDFPRVIDVELTNTCNFHCLMCPVGTSVQVRPKGIMSDEVFESVLDQAAQHKTPLRFILWGEPTLHPKWLDWMERAVARGLLVHFNTNGSRIGEADMRRLVQAGVQSMKFSFQGVDGKSYREMRNTDYFEELMAKVKLLHDVRGEAAYPYIHVSTTITYEGPELVAAFRERVSAFTDKITVGRTELERFDISKAKLSEQERAALSHMKGEEQLVRKHPQCPEVFDKLSVYWDGRVSACCRDFDGAMLVGDVRKTPLAEIWKAEKLAFYREHLAKGEYDRFELCKVCWDYHGLQTPGLQGL
ncbi:radical SAM protein [Humidesulfovibrio idahonensis]